MRIFATATDHFNIHVYACMIPQYYMSDIPQIVKDGFLTTPIYDSEDTKAMGRSLITISRMVQLKITKVPFQIIRDRDVLEILHAIDNYLKEVNKLDDPVVKKYIKNVLQLRPDIYHNFRKILNRHPVWKEAYMGQTPMVSTLTSLYGLLNMDISMVDPLELLRDPPIKVDQVAPPSAPTNTGSLYDV